MKKILFALLCALSCSSTIRPVSTPEKIATLVTLSVTVSGGYRAEQLNEEYTRYNKRPDTHMRLIKLGLIGATAFGLDYYLGDGKNIPRDLGRVAALGISYLATSQVVADFVKQIPVISGLLTDPIDKHGNEMTDIGAYGRGVLTYIGLREIVKYCTHDQNKRR